MTTGMFWFTITASCVITIVFYFIGRHYGYKRAYVVQDQQVALWHGYSCVKSLVKANALHKKRGTRLQDASAISILVHAAEELDELRFAPDDIEELADLVAILFHYMVYKGWTPARLDDAIIKKLNERF